MFLFKKKTISHMIEKNAINNHRWNLCILTKIFFHILILFNYALKKKEVCVRQLENDIIYLLHIYYIR